MGKCQGRPARLNRKTVRTILLILTIVSFLALFGVANSTFAQKKLVGIIQNNSVFHGSGCYFGKNLKSSRFIFLSDLEGVGKNAWMNIDGKDVRLRLIFNNSPKKERIGSRFMRRYVANGIKVETIFLATSACDDCEFGNYRATFVVHRGRRMVRVKAVGECGS